MQFKGQGTWMVLAILLLLSYKLAAKSTDALNSPLTQPDAYLSAPEEVCAGSGELTFIRSAGALPFTIYYTADDGTVDVDTVIVYATGQTIDIHPVKDVTYRIIYIKDAHGRERATNFSPAATASVSVNPLPDASLDVSATSVCDGDALNLIFNFCEGTGPFDVTYNVTTSGGTVSRTARDLFHGSPVEVTPGEDAIYTITSVTDASGCSRTCGFNATHVTESVTVTPLPTGRLVAQTPDICLGETTALIFESAPGKTFDLTYSDGSRQHTLVNMENGDLVYVTPKAGTTYSLVSITGANCTRTEGFDDDATINVHTPVTFTVATVCAGKASIFTVENSLAGSIYWWDFNGDGDIDETTTESVVAYVYQKGGNYEATLNVNNTSSCPASISKKLTIATVPAAFAGNDTSIVRGDRFIIPATANGNYSYQWSPEKGLSNPHALNPEAFPSETTLYTLKVMTAEGCTAYDEILVTVTEAEPFKIYNTFTPDNDHYNDVWVIDGIRGYPDNMVAIFDRWGNRLFLSRGYSQPWNGTSNGKELEAGTYYYVVRLNNDTPPIKGTVNIIR